MNNLFFGKEDVKKLKRVTNKQHRKFIDEMLCSAKAALDDKVYDEAELRYEGEGYQAQHEYYFNASSPFSEVMPLLALGYYYYDDIAYFEKAREFMLAYSKFEKWHGRGWVARSELTTAGFCEGMAFGYAFFSDMLSDDEKEIIVSATYEKGIRASLEDWILPGTKVHALETMGHNWWPDCVIGGGFAALIMSDKLKDGKELAEKAMLGVHQWMTYQGNEIDSKPANDDNGGYWEGNGYCNWPIVTYIKFAAAYKKIIGDLPFDDVEFIKKRAKFIINCFYPTDNDDCIASFGDAPVTGLRLLSLYALAYGVDMPELRWYVNEQTHRDKYDYLSVRMPEVFAYSEIYEKERRIPDKLSVCYEKMGWAIFRDSYEKDANLLAVKCGDTWEHCHADAGNFILFRNGVNEIFDPGTVYYGKNAYIDYLITSKAHNVVLYNGCGQDKRDFLKAARLKGKLINFVDKDGLRCVTADITGPMSRWYRKHLRHFVWIDNIIVIYDDIEAHEDGELTFLLHAQENNCFKMLTPCKAEIMTVYDEDKEHPVQCMAYSAATKGCKGKFVSVLCLDSGTEVCCTELKDGCRIEYGETTVYINYLSDDPIAAKNCINSFDDLVTDGIMAVKSSSRYGVVNGSILRKNGKSITDTLARVTKIEG